MPALQGVHFREILLYDFFLSYVRGYKAALRGSN